LLKFGKIWLGKNQIPSPKTLISYVYVQMLQKVYGKYLPNNGDIYDLYMLWKVWHLEIDKPYLWNSFSAKSDKMPETSYVK